MWSAATVLVCALDLLGRSVTSLPPINLVEVRPPDVSIRAEAFVRGGDKTIYLMASSPALMRAQRARYKCGELNDLRRIASVLVHEEWHVRNGPDEVGAYQAQLMALRTLNAGSGNPVYAGVLRAMKEAVTRHPQQARGAAMDAPTQFSESR